MYIGSQKLQAAVLLAADMFTCVYICMFARNVCVASTQTNKQTGGTPCEGVSSSSSR